MLYRSTSTWTYTGPASLTTNGTYTIQVQSTDNVGNTSATATRTFVYDSVNPSFGAITFVKNGNCDSKPSVSGTTIFYNPTVAHCANAFNVRAPVPAAT